LNEIRASFIKDKESGELHPIPFSILTKPRPERDPGGVCVFGSAGTGLRKSAQCP